MRTEEWRRIPNSPAYEASSCGRIRGPRGIMKGCRDKDGYITHFLRASEKPGSRKAHQLVCEAFHGPCPLGHQVAHLDGSKTNNRPENLEWVTCKENARHRQIHGTQAWGTRISNSVLDEAIIEAIWLSPAGVNAESRKWGVSRQTIHHIRIGKTWGRITATLPPQPPRPAWWEREKLARALARGRR